LGRVRARVADGRALRDDVRDRRVARAALADVVRGVGGAGDVIVVDDSGLSLLDVDPIPPDVPGREVGGAETIRAVPVEAVLEEVVGAHVQDGDAVRVYDDA